MSASFLSGLAFVILLTAIPAVGLLVVWRRTRPESPGFRWALWAVPVFAFVFGGVWFAVPDWLAREPGSPPGAMSVWGLFVLSGVFSISFCLGGLFAVGFGLALLKAVSPVTFARLTARRESSARVEPGEVG